MDRFKRRPVSMEEAGRSNNMPYRTNTPTYLQQRHGLTLYIYYPLTSLKRYAGIAIPG